MNAAFYEANRPSARNNSFTIPVETVSPPCQSAGRAHDREGSGQRLEVKLGRRQGILTSGLLVTQGIHTKLLRFPANPGRSTR